MATPHASEGTIVLTGANGSLGSTMVTQITTSSEHASNYHGIYTIRNANLPSSALTTALAVDRGAQAHDILSLDLSNLASVRATAATINERVASGAIPPIRALILNAGYLEFAEQTWVPEQDGRRFDTTFASNYLGHWLFTLLLLRSMDRERGRIVVVGSDAHDPFHSKGKNSYKEEKYQIFMREDDGVDPIAFGTWSSAADDPSFHAGFRRYGASKFCMAMMIGELQRRLDTDPNLSKICVLGVDPGSMPGNLTHRAPWYIRIIMFKLILPWLAVLSGWLQPNGPFRTLNMGAEDILAGALDSRPPLGESPKGLYLYGSRLEEIAAEAQDVKKRERLWMDSVGYTGLKGEETVLQNWS